MVLARSGFGPGFIYLIARGARASLAYLIMK